MGIKGLILFYLFNYQSIKAPWYCRVFNIAVDCCCKERKTFLQRDEKMREKNFKIKT